MNIRINGKNETLDKQMTILDLLDQKKFKKEKVVIELNGKIISRDHLDSICIQDKDTIEIVSFVGGG